MPVCHNYLEGVCHILAFLILQSPGLFDGCEFFFRGSFPPPHPSKQDIQMLVSLAGGQFLTREPRVDSDSHSPGASSYPFHAQPGSVFASCHQFILYNPLSVHHRPAVISARKLIITPASWVLDCLSTFELIHIPSGSSCP